MSDRFSRYNRTEKGKARNRKAQANLSPEQKELQRIRKRDYMRRKRMKLLTKQQVQLLVPGDIVFRVQENKFSVKVIVTRNDNQCLQCKGLDRDVHYSWTYNPHPHWNYEDSGMNRNLLHPGESFGFYC